MSELRPVGDRALLVTCADPPGMARSIRDLCAARGLPVVEIVPAARTVLVQLRSAGQLPELRELLALTAGSAGPAPHPPPALELTVHFDGPDLADVAEACATSVAGVVSLMTATTFTAAFTGFVPGFAYLAGLPAALRLPRRDQPRTRVPAGSLAIADTYAAIYPRASPGGWHLLGRTDAVLFDPDRAEPALIAAGAVVRFRLSA